MMALAGGLVVGLPPSEPRTPFATAIIGPNDRPPSWMKDIQLTGRCFSMSETTDLAPPTYNGSDPDESPIRFIGSVREGHSFRILWRTRDRARYGIVEVDRFGNNVAFYRVVRTATAYFIELSERLIPCPEPLSRECQRWPGELWAYALGQASKYRNGKVDQQREKPNYWVARALEARGFKNDDGTWHPEPMNCVS
jgi:hypothetical protein